MKSKNKYPWALIVGSSFFLLFITFSCSLFKKAHSPETLTSPSPIKDQNQSLLQAPNSAAAISGLPEAEMAMATRNYSKALEIYHTYLEKEPDQIKIKNDFLTALAQIKKEADSLKNKGKYSSALSFYRLIFKYSQNLTPEEKNLAFASSDLTNEIRECRVKLQRNEAEKAFQAGQFDQAINLLVIGLQEYPEEPSLKTYLTQILQELISQAQVAMASKDWLRAGQLYSLLKSSRLKHEKTLAPFPLSLEEINKSIKYCSQQLTNLGLIEYRKGNLKEAIALWEKILLFQPENEEIKRAIQTAKAQLEKIKKD